MDKKMPKLKKLRDAVDGLDEKIVDLLNQRASIARDIRETKKKQGAGRYTASREKKVYEHVCAHNKGPLSNNAIKACYREIMSGALALDRPLRIAFLGPLLTFTYIAAEERFGSQVEYVCCDTISEVFREVEKNRADFGVVPVENSIEGAVNHTFDMFIDSELKICSEIKMSISHCLMSKSKVPLHRIKKIWSKAEVFGQCRGWLEKNVHGANLTEALSTARAAKMVENSKDKYCAAIAGEKAAKKYNLTILARSIEDSGENITRFIIIGKENAQVTGKDKTSIVFSIKDKVGALYSMLLPFKNNKINLTKIESRPSKKKAWDYFFFVDMEGHCEDKKVKVALSELEKQCVFLKILGSYPVAD